MTLVEMPPAIVPEPKWSAILSRAAEREAATEHWRSITREMEARDLLSPANGHAIMRLVLARIMHDRAAAKAMRQGPVSEPKKANPRAIARPNLYFAAMREAAAMSAQLEADLGLSPRTRNRVGKVPKVARIATGAARYLKSVPSLPAPVATLPSPIVSPEKEPTDAPA